MQITMPAIPSAPLVSGHPYGLPAPPGSPDPRRVEAAKTTDNTDMSSERRLATGPSEELEAALERPSDHIAPPSIMQLRIAAMLDTQSGERPPEQT